MALRVSVAQFQPRSSYAQCVQLLLELMENVAMSYTDETRPEVLVLAELFLGGYHNSHQFYENAIDVQGDLAESTSTLARICEGARRYSLAVCFGYCEKVLSTAAESDAQHLYYNSVLFVGADGSVVANSRKTHLWGPRERRFFSPGDRLGPVFCYNGVRIGMLICFDVEFPETCRTLRKMGAQLIIVPTALVSKFNALVTIPSRAAENGVFVVYANELGQAVDAETGDIYKYCGRSCIVGPDGEDIARCSSLEDSKDEDEVRTATVAPDNAKYLAAIARNPYLECLRPELYAVV
jgi:predicted amidohydrolase